MSAAPWLAAIIVGYLLGAVSFAVIVARSRGVDILTQGSGNPGATNVKRVLGARLGNTVFALDAGKGLVAAGWPLLVFAGDGNTAVNLGVAGLAAAILGHSFSVFLKFRGGKGVATTMGGLLVLMPWVLLAGLLVWLAFFLTTRIVAIASIAFGISLPIAAWLLGSPPALTILASVLAVLLVVRHRSNIARILRGEENVFKKK